jgi:hypothetical protein
MKGQTSAFINLSIFPQICQKAVFAAAVCKTDMSGNTFQIRILFDKCAKYLFLLVTIRLERNITLYIACSYTNSKDEKKSVVYTVKVVADDD